MSAWEDLLTECQRLEDKASKIQDGETIGLSPEEIKKLSDEYLTRFGKCLAVLPEDIKNKFRAEYEGTYWTAKIKRFFEAATETNMFYNPQAPNVLSYWLYSYKQNFYPAIQSQRQLLIEASQRKQQMNSSEVENEEAWNETVRRIFKVFIEKANKASTANEKKLTYEYLALFLIGSIDGLTVIGHDERGVSEEIDLWVSNSSSNIFWQKMPAAFFVECKNWGIPVGVPELRTLRAIMDDKNLSLAILLTRNGVTGNRNRDAGDIVRNAFRDNKYILVLTEADLLEIANGMPPTEKIKQKYFDLYVRS